MNNIQFILYTKDQQIATSFYTNLLQKEPTLNVPGMTEFSLFEGVKLGLMPEDGIAKILSDKTPHPSKGNGIPRCELYLNVENAQDYIQRGILLGAVMISEFKNRDWGDRVGYIADLDGHIIAFVE